MKEILLILFLFAGSSKSYLSAQIALTTLKEFKIITLPFSTENTASGFQVTHFSGSDSCYITCRLQEVKPFIVFPEGGTSFGRLDCSAENTCFTDEDAFGSIDVYGKIVVEGGDALYIVITEKGTFGASVGIVALFDKNGRLISWITASANANAGNLNGNLSREMVFLKDGTIRIVESAWGNNSESYTLSALLYPSTLSRQKFKVLSQDAIR